jgi:hypothetical protein
MANWQPNGFVGKMFEVVSRHAPPPPGLPSPLLWGDETTVRNRFNGAVKDIRFRSRIARLRFPFAPSGTVDFFRRYFGPTQRAFNALAPAAQEKFHKALVELQTQHNVAVEPNETDNPSAYLEVQARR